MRALYIEMKHQGEYLCYYEIGYKLENGRIKTYEIVSKSGSKHSDQPPLTLETLGKHTVAVSMIVFNKDHSKILLNKELRLGVNQWVYNPSAGLIDSGETPEEAAIRELREETGLKLTKIIDQLPPYFTCAPVTDDMVIPFICEAEGEILGSDNPVEVIKSHWATKDEALEILKNPDNKFSAYMGAIVYMWANGENI